MASIDDVIQAIDGALDQIGDALDATDRAEDQAEEFQDAMVAHGVEDKAQGGQAIKDALEGLAGSLRAAKDTADEIQNLARQVKG